MAKFSEVFAFLAYFQARHLGVEIEDVLGEPTLQEVGKLEKCFAELQRIAFQRIEDEGISSDFLMACPACGEETFVTENLAGVCYLCRTAEDVVECPHCHEIHFANDMENFSGLIDADCEEGQPVVYNDYGYRDYTACPSCLLRIREDIEDQRARAYYHECEMDAWYRRRDGDPR
jgi:hypothetical protein